MATPKKPKQADYEIYRGSGDGYKGACRHCRYATAESDTHTVNYKMFNHLATKHGISSPRPAS